MRTRLLSLCGLGVVVALLAGCAAMAADGVYWDRVAHKAVYQDTDSTQTPGERMNMFKRVVDKDAAAIVDDIDHILLRDRPSRLSRWHDR